MGLKNVLEELSLDTWERLRDSQQLQIRFGEETITDLLLLDLKRKNPPCTRIVQTPKFKEKNQGTDWEWWIGSQRLNWLRFAVQAKKLDLNTMRYPGFAHKVGPHLQIDLLEKYATQNKAIPIYCFYNFQNSPATTAWHCCERFEEPQLACTVAPIHVVRNAIALHGCRTFSWIHKHPETMPWRCLACNAKRLFRSSLMRTGPLSQDPAQPLFKWAIHRYERLPSEIEEVLGSGRRVSFSPQYYDPNLGLYPRRVAVLEFDSAEEEMLIDG